MMAIANRWFKVLALPVGLLVPASSALANWYVTWDMRVPQATFEEARRPDTPKWKRWKFYDLLATSRCWKLDTAVFPQGGEPDDHTYATFEGPTVIANKRRVLDTDPVACRDDREMNLHVIFYSVDTPGLQGFANYQTFKSQHRFHINNEGLFGPNIYYVDGKVVERKYFENATLCTTIIVYGEDRPDDVETHKCDRKPQ